MPLCTSETDVATSRNIKGGKFECEGWKTKSLLFRCRREEVLHVARDRRSVLKQIVHLRQVISSSGYFAWDNQEQVLGGQNT